MATLKPPPSFPGQGAPGPSNQFWFNTYLSNMAWSSAYGIVRSCFVVILPAQLLWAVLSYPGGGVGFGVANLVGAPLVAGVFSVFYMVAFRFIYSVSWMPYLSRAEAIWNRLDLFHAAFLGVSCVASCFVIYSLLAFNDGPTERHWVIICYSCILAVAQCLYMIYKEETVIQFPPLYKAGAVSLDTITSKVKQQIETGLDRGVPSGLLACSMIMFLTCYPQDADTAYFCLGRTTVGFLDRLWVHLIYGGIVATMMWSVARRVFVANHCTLGCKLEVRDGYVNSPHVKELISSLEMDQLPLLQYLAHKRLCEIATNPSSDQLHDIFTPRVLASQRDTSALWRAVHRCNAVIKGQAELIDRELGGVKGTAPALPPTLPVPTPQQAEPDLKTLLMITWDHCVLPLGSWRIEIGKWLLGERYNVQPRSAQHAVFPGTERPRQVQPPAFGTPQTNGFPLVSSPNSTNRPLHRPSGVVAFNAMVANPQAQNVGPGMGLRSEASIKQTPRAYLSSYLAHYRTKLINLLKGLRVFSDLFVEQREYRVRLVFADWQMVDWAIIGVSYLIAQTPPDKQFNLPQSTVEALGACILAINKHLFSGDRQYLLMYHGEDLLTQLYQGLSLILQYNRTVTVDPKVIGLLETYRRSLRGNTPARETSVSRSPSRSPSVRRSTTPGRRDKSPTPVPRV